MNLIPNRLPGLCIRLLLLLLLLISCTPSATIPSSTLRPVPSPVETAGGLSPDATNTLNSLEKVAEYPFYTMQYVGSYDYPQVGGTLVGLEEFSCSLFASLAQGADMFYGRNFDWDYSPALLLFTDPPDGYASASMVDLTFLDIDPLDSRTLDDLPVEERSALLSAPSMPFDGMNEYGLAVGMAAVPSQFIDDASHDPSLPTIGSIGILRQVLDHARNVEEALVMFRSYNIDFRGGPPIHYLLADPAGKAVLVEYYQGEMIELPNTDPWHMATNFMVCLAEGDASCPRYRTLSNTLSASSGLLDPPSAMRLLSEVSQGITQWSTLYNLTTGEIGVVIGGEYGKTYSFNLEMMK